MAGDFRPPERIKNSLDNRKLTLSTPCPGQQGKWSSLSWGLYSNNPRITVYTNHPDDTGPDKGYGKITANLDLPVFVAFLKDLDTVIEGPNDVKRSIENKNFTFFGGKRSDVPAVVSTLHYGKNKDGEVWLSITAPNRPKIQFKFGSGSQNFHNFIHGDGTPFSVAEFSVLTARAYIDILERMMTHLAVNLFVEPPKKDAPQGNRQGGGNYGGGGNRGGGGGGSKPSFDDSDDLPF